MGTKPAPHIYVNYHFYLFFSPSLFITLNSEFMIRVHCVWSHVEDQTKEGVNLTCWISGDRVSISQPLLGANLRSSEKDKRQGNDMIQRGDHSRKDIKSSIKWIQTSCGTALPKFEFSWMGQTFTSHKIIFIFWLFICFFSCEELNHIHLYT